MDLQVVERENRVLGQDFLTWLWYRVEAEGGTFQLPGSAGFEVIMEERMQVQGGEGEHVETATVQSPSGALYEAKTGLKTGKKVAKAQFRFEADGETWQVMIRAEDFALSGLKTPKVDKKDAADEDPDGVFLEKIYLIERCLEMIDEPFAQFLKLRLSPGWPEEAQKVGQWVTRLE